MRSYFTIPAVVLSFFLGFQAQADSGYVDIGCISNENLYSNCWTKCSKLKVRKGAKLSAVALFGTGCKPKGEKGFCTCVFKTN